MAMAHNVFYPAPRNDQPAWRGFASFEQPGRVYESVAAFREALQRYDAWASQTGRVADEMPLRDPANHDFRPTEDSAVQDRGVKVFVPWALYGVVGEWHFYRYPADPSVVVGENFCMTDEYVHRDMYYDVPRNDLTAHGVDIEDYTAGPLENWTEGALRFDGVDTCCVLPNEELECDYDYTLKGETHIYQGEERRTVDVQDGNFLIEVYFQTESGRAGGTLVSKMGPSGYRLAIDDKGRPFLRVRAGSAADRLVTNSRVNDGEWHHLVAEVDRTARLIRFYLDGGCVAECVMRSISPGDSLSNDADFLVGRGADGDYFAGKMDFLRICRGTLADAETTIEELYEWQFNGPFLRDFCGKPPVGRRDAGAIEAD
jgi:hypothetical protein